MEMVNKTSDLDNVLADDVVQYISRRHHVKAKVVIESVRACGKARKVAMPFSLDDNEIEILRDLIDMYNK